MTENQTTSTKPAKTTTTNLCRCGCGESTSSSRTQYKPGHDARHAGIVARDIASSAQPFFERVTADSDLGSQALIEKAHAMAERLLAKATKTPADRKPKSEGKKADKKAVAAIVAQEEAAYAEALAAEVELRRADAEAQLAAEEAEEAGFVTTVKIGRWEYPAKNLDGQIVRNTKRDGSGEWVAV